MKLLLTSAAAILLAGTIAVPSASAGEVKVQLANGRVTIQARDAYVRDILAEWARVGGVKIVNAEKISGAPVTLDLQSVPEGQALTTLLRSVSGYVASPKTAASPAGSMYATVIVMSAPRSLVNANVGSMSQPQAPPQQYYRGMQGPVIMDDQDQPVGPPPTYPNPVYQPGAYPQGPRGMQQPAQPGGVTPAPQPGQIPTGAAGTISPMPQQPGGAAQPGMTTPGGTGALGTVSQPPKRPGGPGGPGGGPGGEAEPPGGPGGEGGPGRN